MIPSLFRHNLSYVKKILENIATRFMKYYIGCENVLMIFIFCDKQINGMGMNLSLDEVFV